MTLIAAGDLSFSDIKNLKVVDLLDHLESVSFLASDLLPFSNDLIASEPGNNFLFCYTSGRQYSVKDVENLLIRSHRNAGFQYEGRFKFVKRVKESLGRLS